MTEHPRTTINVTIRADLKARFDFFIAWLKRYHGNKETIWTQNTAMDEVLNNTRLWRAYLDAEAIL